MFRYCEEREGRIQNGRTGVEMKRAVVFFLGFLILIPSFAQSQGDKFFEIFGPRINPSDLRILQLEMKPDPAHEGQWIRFEAIVSNLSSHPGKVSLFIKERDRTVSSLHDVRLYPGYNQVVFPESNYRFSHDENCFTVEVDIERTKRPVDAVKKFCARRTYYGWTLSSIWVGPLFVEDLEMFPDPVHPGQEVRFKIRLRNDGSPLRANLRIHDRDQIVTELKDAFLPNGYAEFYFPYTRYFFQQYDQCFTVMVDVERTLYKADSRREFCARPLGWTLRP